MKYKVKRQTGDERMFYLEDENGNHFFVDIYTDGGLNVPQEYLDEKDGKKAVIIFEKWLKSFVDKTLEIEEITPLYYSTKGKIKISNHA